MGYSHSFLAATLFAALSPWALDAQVVTTSPAVVQTDSHGIVITFHADRGNRGLIDLPAGETVYAHTGVITSASGSDSDWKYAPAWGDNAPKYRLTRASTNEYTLAISDIAGFYGIPASSGEMVRKLAFVFRNASSTKEGKSDTNGDIYVDVLPPGLQVVLSTDIAGEVIGRGSTVGFTALSTEPADISLYIGDTQGEPVSSESGVDRLSANYVFPTGGDFTVTAKAVAGGKTATATTRLTVIGDPVARPYPGGEPVQGAVRDDATGDVTFCIAAPGKKSAVIVGAWDDYQVKSRGEMFYHDYDGTRYFWTTVKGLLPSADYPYYYLIDGARKVSDPYARLILDPYNDRYIPASVYPGMPRYPSDKVSDVPLAVYRSDIDSYDWQVDGFKGVEQSDLVIYELLIRDFTGAEGRADASGTVAGVLSKLDYLKELGVNAIELLPIMEFDGNNSWGYNTNFYFAPDKAYGTPDDYRRLVDECHRRGMAVILDIVFNQSAGLHPWYMMYDIADNPFYNGSAPHAYSVLNDWNQDNPLVERQWADALRYWLTAYKVDGFRFDLVKGLGDNDSYGNTYDPANNTWGTPTDAGTNAYNRSRVERMARLHAAMREVNPDAYFINENLAGAKEENEMAADGDANWANINTESRQFAMGYADNSGLARFYAPLDSRTWGSTVSYAESHDEERMAYAQQKWGAAGVKGNTPMSMRRLGSVGAQMLMSPGAHMIWQFQEFGADQTTKSPDGGNDTSPKKVIWSYLDNPDRAGLMRSYTELCHLRADNPALFRQGVATTLRCAASDWSAGRYINLVDGQTQLLCVVNPDVGRSVTVSVPMIAPGESYKILSASYSTTPVVGNGSVKLLPGAYAVIGTADVATTGGIRADTPALSHPSVTLDADNRLVITGVYHNATLCGTDGRLYPIDAPLTPGLYIATVDGLSTKLLVR